MYGMIYMLAFVAGHFNLFVKKYIPFIYVLDFAYMLCFFIKKYSEIICSIYYLIKINHLFRGILTETIVDNISHR